MTHEELRDRLLELAYGELSPRDARAVEEHAGGCEACGAELARIRATRRLMSALPEEPAPPGGERILLAAAREAARRRSPQRALPRWLWAGSIVAASLTLVVAVSYRVVTMRSGSAGREDPNAIMGASPYARAPQPAEPPSQQRDLGAPGAKAGSGAPTGAAPAGAAPAGAGVAPKRSDEARAAGEARPEKKRSAPRPAEPPARAESPPATAAPPAFAVPPPAPAEPPHAAAARERSEAERPAAALAERDAALPPAASMAAPRPAPPRAAQAMPAPGARAPESSPRPGATDAARSDPVARYEALRSAGRLTGEERKFPGCERELWRRVERDPEGRVVAYAWEEMVGTQRLRLEAVYAPDGRLARKRAFDAATLAPKAIEFRAPRAEDVDVDAPPRCGG